MRMHWLKLAVLALVVGALSASLAAQTQQLLRDNDDGQVQVVRAGDVAGKQANQLKFHGGPVIQNPRQYSVFLGAGWADNKVRDRESSLLALGNSDKSNGAAWMYEDFSVLGPSVSDLELQHSFKQLLTSGAIPRPGRNTIYVVYLAPGTQVTLGPSKSGNDFVAYHNFVHLDGSVVCYVVVPWTGDAGQQKDYAAQAFTQAAKNPIGNGWY